MRLTKPRLADCLPPRKQQLHDWANAWVQEIAKEAGGFKVDEFWKVRSVVHEIRKRIESGDYSHPEQPEVAQGDLLKAE